MDTYKSETKRTWCPGCGDFAVRRALQTAIHALQLEPWNILVVSGIGCSSNLPHFLSTYGFHAIHGRALPVAEGAKLANRSEEHTSEFQSHHDLVCRLLLEKKKKEYNLHSKPT